MTLFSEIRYLVAKEIKLEWRLKYAFSGVLLYLFSTVFIIYISFFDVKPEAWNILFWIILLFTAVNAIAKSFLQESAGRLLYYYFIVSPQAILLSKMIYNTALMLLLGVLGLIIYSILVGNPVVLPWYFLFTVLMGSISFSLIFTMISAIASKAGNNFTLMAILSFPVIIPVLLLLMKLSLSSITGNSFPLKDFLILALIDIIVVMAAYILFPYLWRD
jgi:heme exporter protein B